MKWLWKLKALIYDPTIRRIGPIHSFMRFLVRRLSDILLTIGCRLKQFEVPRSGVAPYFLFPYVFGTHEREVIAWYRQYLREGMCVVDIGAYVGYHTIRFARLVGRTGKVVAFEPYSPSFEILKRNVQRAKLTNVVLEQKAVSGQNGYVTLHIADSWAGNSLIKVDGRHNQGCQVEGVTLEDYFGGDETLDLVKIDAEGSELAILQGMRSLIAKGKLRRIESHEVEDFVTSVSKWTNLCAIRRE